MFDYFDLVEEHLSSYLFQYFVVEFLMGLKLVRKHLIDLYHLVIKFCSIGISVG